MIRYTVTVTLPDATTVERFMAWLTGGHIAQVIAGGATSAEICRVDGDAMTFDILYLFESREKFIRYESNYAPALREEGRQLFPPALGVVYNRRVSESLTTFPEVP